MAALDIGLGAQVFEVDPARHRPALGQHVAWGESNAVAFCNAVLGAPFVSHLVKADPNYDLMRFDPATGLWRPPTPEGLAALLDQALAAGPLAAVVLVSPSYQGLVGDLPELIAVAHRRGVPVLLIEHDVKLVMGLCDRVAVLENKAGIPALLATMYKLGAPALLNFGSEQDAKNSAQVIAVVDQGGLGLPDRVWQVWSMQAEAVCTFPGGAVRRESVLINGVAVLLGVHQGTLKDDQTIAGELPAPIRRGPRVITPATKKSMQKILKEIQSGKFAKEWIAESESGRAKFNALRAAGASHQIEEVGKRLRGMMPWISAGKQKVSEASGG